MKLYTEEQVRNMLDTFLLFTGNEDANDYIEYMTPIELPSDEEIGAYVESTGYYGHCTHEYHEGIEEGAKWMRDKLTNTKEK